MKKSDLVSLIKECMDEMTNLDLSSMNEEQPLQEAFSKQHFIAIADIIKNLNGVPEVKAHLVDQFAEMFKKDNPRFDEARFRAYVNSKE